ncbi:MAG TPA: hypothetical protein VFY25_09800 [Anaerolineales bacterium]|nr:hypothetical protein [Anaerolineales bacterium]
MKKQTVFLLLAVFVSSLACQFLLPARTGTVVSNCAEIVSAMTKMQSVDIPNHLLETSIKTGNELDINQYFDVLTHLSMREGYVLDYVYQSDDLGAYPLPYARPRDQAPYASPADIPNATELPDFRDYVEVQDLEQGYFEYAALDIMADQFYLYWHANYNDYEIVCNKAELSEIVDQVSSGDFGVKMSPVQQARARAIRNIEPSVSLNGDTATVQVITFSKWGGFYRETYTIGREFPHQIIDVKQDNLVPYDCGVAF